MPYFGLTSAFLLSPLWLKVCALLRFACATCSGQSVRLTPVLLCALLRLLHGPMSHGACPPPRRPRGLSGELAVGRADRTSKSMARTPSPGLRLTLLKSKLIHAELFGCAI